mgnify:FL=1
MKKNFNSKNFVGKVNVTNSLLKSLVFIQKNYSPDKQKKHLSDLKNFKKFINNCERKLKNSNKKVIIISFNSNNKYKINHVLMKNITEIASSFLGDLVAQNKEGKKNVVVYDRGRNLSINKGARYHQTREGGSIHTDNVNVSSKWKYMILSCLAEGQVGGETILVSAKNVYEKLKKNFKQANKILQKKFIWEKRGVAKSFYTAPILKINENGEPEFRYLRPYLESAHIKKKKPLSDKQLYALDVLDALLDSSENQYRCHMKSGDLVLALDSQVLHGRTCFSDYYKSKSVLANNATKLPLKRTMVRTWIKA